MKRIGGATRLLLDYVNESKTLGPAIPAAGADLCLLDRAVC